MATVKLQTCSTVGLSSIQVQGDPCPMTSSRCECYVLQNGRPDPAVVHVLLPRFKSI